MAKCEMGKFVDIRMELFTFSAIIMVPFWFPMHSYYYYYYYLRIGTKKQPMLPCCHIKKDRTENYVSPGKIFYAIIKMNVKTEQ